jgi:hypothetical protein
MLADYLGLQQKPPWAPTIEGASEGDLEVLRQSVRVGRRTPALEAMLCMRRLGR